MKIAKLLLTLIVSTLLTGNVWAQNVWDILNKDMSVCTDNPVTDTNYPWGTVPVNGAVPAGETANVAAFKTFITQYSGFVRLQKPVLSGTGTFFLNPNVTNKAEGTFHNAIKANTSYTVELKLQVNPQYKGETDGNEVRLRLSNRVIDFFISYGDGTIGYVGKAVGGNDFEIDPTVPHIYRVEYIQNDKYNLYVDDQLAFSEAVTSNTNPNILVVGAGVAKSCNMDVYYVKMKTAGASTWDILDKDMNNWNCSNRGWNVNGGADNNKAWELTKGSRITDTSGMVTQETGYVNILKTGTFDGNNYAFLTPPAMTLTPNTAYTFEVKARMKPIDKNTFPDIAPPVAGTGGFESNQISARLNEKNMTIYAKYGNEEEGYISLGDSLIHKDVDKYMLNTSEWHVYRFVFHEDNVTYDVYVDSFDKPVFKNAQTSPMTGTNILRLGGHTNHRCNMDIEYVKMGTGDFNANNKPQIASVVVSSDSHVANHERTIQVIVNTRLIATGEKMLLSLVDETGTEVLSPVEIAVVNDKQATGNLVIPASVPIGKYAVKVAVPNDKIGDDTIDPVSVQYVVVDVSPIETKMFPQVKPVSFVKDIKDYKYIGPSKEFIMPCILDTKEHTTDGKFLNGQSVLDRYYLYYTPHENPGGMYLSTAPTLEGPWTERGTVIDLAWAKAVKNNSVNTASHISGCFVDWNEELNKYIMYFHGPNSVTHYATSDNLITWSFGATVANAKDFSTIGAEASYAKVYKHAIPGLGNKYVMLLMNQEAQVRRIYWAHSKDGIHWTHVRKALVAPDLDHKKIPGTNIKPNYSSDPNANIPGYSATFGKNNVAGSTLMIVDGRTFIICNGSSGHIFAVEVGEKFDMEVHWGEYIKASDVMIDKDDNGNPLAAPRIAAPMFIKDDNGKIYMFFECGGRIGANIAYAKEVDTPNSMTSPISKNMQIYPSVVERGEKLTVKAENADELTIEIINISGNKISDTKINNSVGEIQAPAVPGLYFVKITTNENKMETSKIVVK